MEPDDTGGRGNAARPGSGHGLLRDPVDDSAGPFPSVVGKGVPPPRTRRRRPRDPPAWVGRGETLRRRFGEDQGHEVGSHRLSPPHPPTPSRVFSQKATGNSHAREVGRTEEVSHDGNRVRSLLRPGTCPRGNWSVMECFGARNVAEQAYILDLTQSV